MERWCNRRGEEGRWQSGGRDEGGASDEKYSPVFCSTLNFKKENLLLPWSQIHWPLQTTVSVEVTMCKSFNVEASLQNGTNKHLHRNICVSEAGPWDAGLLCGSPSVSSWTILYQRRLWRDRRRIINHRFSHRCCTSLWFLHCNTVWPPSIKKLLRI